MFELLMSRIFISYSSQHRDLTAKLAERLEAEGYPVWWDISLEACGPYDTQIEQALQDAAAVIVIWSVGAAKSDWVRGEVIKARASHKLVNLRAPDFPLQDIPAPFNDVEHVITLNLDDLEPVLKTVNTVWRGEVPVGIKPRYLSHRDQFGVDLFSPKQLPRPDDIRELLPSHLLQARYEVVPYVDATGLLAEMMDWCLGQGEYKETPRTTAGRLLFGPGGQGKTRLMIELARKLRDEHGWLAGFAEPPRHPNDHAEMMDREQSIAQILSGGEEPGVLMILDYAEGRRDEVVKLAQSGPAAAARGRASGARRAAVPRRCLVAGSLRSGNRGGNSLPAFRHDLWRQYPRSGPSRGQMAAGDAQQDPDRLSPAP